MCIYVTIDSDVFVSLSLKTGCDSARFLGAVSREGDRSILCVPGVLCGALVPGRVLVLLPVHPLHAGHLRGHSRQTGLRNLLLHIHTSHIQLSEIPIHIHMISNYIFLSLSHSLPPYFPASFSLSHTATEKPVGDPQDGFPALPSSGVPRR